MTIGRMTIRVGTLDWHHRRRNLDPAAAIQSLRLGGGWFIAAFVLNAGVYVSWWKNR